MTNNRQQLEQGRASIAYARVKEFVDSKPGENVLGEYKSYSKKFPMMVKTNGLGAALAFICSKNSNAYKRLYKDLTVWLNEDMKKIVNLEQRDLLQQVVNMDDAARYRALTNEVLAFMNWHRRFTEGMIKSNTPQT